MEAGINSAGARKPKRTRDPSDKRERILRAAIRVFARKGFYATRVSEIAKAAGVADGTIYLYFKNKDDVLITLFEERVGRLIDELEREATADAPVLERLSRIIAIQLGQLEGRRDLAEVVTVNLRQSTKLMKQYAVPLFSKYMAVVAKLVAEGQANGEIRTDVEPDVVSRALWGSLDGVLLTWTVQNGDDTSLRKAAHDVVVLYVEGLRAR